MGSQSVIGCESISRLVLAPAPQKLKREEDLSLRSRQQESTCSAVKVTGLVDRVLDPSSCCPGSRSGQKSGALHTTAATKHCEYKTAESVGLIVVEIYF